MFGFLKSAKAKYDEAKDVYRQSDAAWRELNDAFQAAGLNFEKLDTEVRRALQREAMLNGVESTFAQFIKIAGELSTVEQMREVYRLRREAHELMRDPVAEILNEQVGRPKQVRRVYAGQSEPIVIGEVDGPTMGRPIKAPRE